MNVSDLADMLNARAKRGAFFATIETLTVPSMRKTNNPFYDRIDKLSRVNVTCNWLYENAVNRQRLREWSEPDFVAEPRKWGFRIPHSPLVQHRGKLYLEAKVNSVLSTEYRCDGFPIDSDTIRAYLSPKSTGRQDLADPVILRDYALDSIQAITLDGIRHEIGYREPVAWYAFGGVG